MAQCSYYRTFVNISGCLLMGTVLVTSESVNLRRVTSLRNLKELPQKWKKSFIAIYKKCDKTDDSNYLGYHLYQLEHQNFIKLPYVKFDSICRQTYCKSLLWFLM